MLNKHTNCHGGAKGSPDGTCDRQRKADQLYHLVAEHFENNGLAPSVDVLATLTNSMFPNDKDEPHEIKWSVSFIRDSCYYTQSLTILLTKMYEILRKDLYNRQNPEQ